MTQNSTWAKPKNKKAKYETGHMNMIANNLVDMDQIITDALMLTEVCVEFLNKKGGIIGPTKNRSQFLHQIRQDVFPMMYSYFATDNEGYKAKAIILQNIFATNAQCLENDLVVTPTISDLNNGLADFQRNTLFTELIANMRWDAHGGSSLKAEHSYQQETAKELARYIIFYMNERNEKDTIQQMRLCGNKLSAAADGHNHQQIEMTAKKIVRMMRNDDVDVDTVQQFKTLIRKSIEQAMEYHHAIQLCERGQSDDFLISDHQHNPRGRRVK